MKMKNILFCLFLMFFPYVCSGQDFFLEKISGDKQLAVRGTETKNDLVVQLTDIQKNPVSNINVDFIVADGSYGSVQKEQILTDEHGYAKSKIFINKKAEDKLTVIATADVSSNPVYFNISVLSKNWIFIMFVTMLGGAALLLCGMFMVNSAFQQIAGQNIRAILKKFTNTRLKGFFTGFMVTGINQSSTATLLLQITLTSAGVMTFFQAMSVTIGASVGSTVTGQLVAFKLVDYALIITAVGYFLSFFSKRRKLIEIGDAIFGFGLLFFGMKLMSDSMLPITLNNELLETIANLQSPLWLILFGIFFTVLTHSSGATVGIIIVLASSGILSLLQGICICLGAQIGTCSTAIVASITQPRSGKRVMLWHLGYQILGVVLVYPFISFVYYKGELCWTYFVKYFTSTFILSNDIARQIAMSHTLVTLFTAFIVLPLVPLLHKFIMFIYPSSAVEKHFGTAFIDEKYIEEPEKALKLAKQEIERLSEIVSDVMKDSINTLKTKHEIVIDKIKYKCLQISHLVDEIIPYITKVGQNELSEKQSERETMLLYIVADFEQIADVINRNIIYIAEEKMRRHLRFSDDGLKDIKYLHNVVYTNCSKIIDSFIKEDKVLAREVSDDIDKLNSIMHELKKNHIARLHAGLQESIETSGLHLDVLDQFMKINETLLDIAINIYDI
ncbi:MAG: Na/Pi symporter [Elusimicrobia bacterium]|nr:Na/Pi symporter [Elusimicrobiota bacterium]